MSDDIQKTGLTAAGKGQNGAEYYFEFRNVTKGFDDRVVLNDVSFKVKRAETCVIMGRSGVGKSVSLKHIMGFLHADSGRVFIDGTDVTNFSEAQFAEIRRKGLTEEDVDAYVSKLAHMLEVEDVLDKIPSELSTGTKRAVAIARALAQNPEAILYDEPTTMVDPIMAGHMGDLILRLKEAFHKTSVVVTHDTHLAKRLADTLVFLQEGKAQVYSTWAEFEQSKDKLVRDFLLQDQLVPALDVTL